MAIIEAEVFPMIWGRVRASGFAAVAAVMLAATAGCETLSQEQPQESEAEILPIIEAAPAARFSLDSKWL